MPNKKILLVDDDRTTRSAVGQVLREEGYEVAIASDGQDAIELLDGTSCDLVITDLAMPRLNGSDLITQLQETHPNVPVIIITGNGDGRQAALLGAADFVTKPIDLEDFLGRVARVVLRARR